MKYRKLIELMPYMSAGDAEKLRDMMGKKMRYQAMLSFANDAITTGVCRYRPIKRYPRAKQKNMEYVEYADQLDPGELDWIKQFYHEYYADGSYSIPDDERIMTNEDWIKEAHRTNNNYNRDLFDVMQNQEILSYISDENFSMDESDVLTIDDLNWEAVLTLCGYEVALDHIVDEYTEQLHNEHLDKRLILIRFYIVMERLRKLNNADKRASRSKDKEDTNGTKNNQE